MSIAIYGCWNYGGEGNGREDVIDTIANDDAITDVFILGDNYYSQVWKRNKLKKEKEKKKEKKKGDQNKHRHTNLDVMEDGFRYTALMYNKRVIFGIGNHEYDEIISWDSVVDISNLNSKESDPKSSWVCDKYCLGGSPLDEIEDPQDLDMLKKLDVTDTTTEKFNMYNHQCAIVKHLQDERQIAGMTKDFEMSPNEPGKMNDLISGVYQHEATNSIFIMINTCDEKGKVRVQKEELYTIIQQIQDNKEMFDMKKSQESPVADSPGEPRSIPQDKEIHVYVMGHTPLEYSKKSQRKSNDTLITYVVDIYTACEKLFTGLSHNRVYLCADEHYYEKSMIHCKPTITQYIVGTGGTVLDSIPTDTTGVVGERIGYHGFLKLSVDRDEPKIEFIPIHVRNVGGGRNKNKRIKSKRTKRKPKKRTNKRRSKRRSKRRTRRRIRKYR